MRRSRIVVGALLCLSPAAALAAPTAQDVARVRAHSGFAALVAEMRQWPLSERGQDSNEAWQRCFNKIDVVGSIIRLYQPSADGSLMLDLVSDDTLAGMDALRRSAGTNVAAPDEISSIINETYATLKANTQALNQTGSRWARCLRDAALVAILGQPLDNAVSSAALAACAANERAFAVAAEIKYRFDGIAEADRRARIADNARKMRASFLASLPRMRANPARFK